MTDSQGFPTFRSNGALPNSLVPAAPKLVNSSTATLPPLTTPGSTSSMQSSAGLTSTAGMTTGTRRITPPASPTSGYVLPNPSSLSTVSSSSLSTAGTRSSLSSPAVSSPGMRSSAVSSPGMRSSAVSSPRTRSSLSSSAVSSPGMRSSSELTFSPNESLNSRSMTNESLNSRSMTDGSLKSRSMTDGSLSSKEESIVRSLTQKGWKVDAIVSDSDGFVGIIARTEDNNSAMLLDRSTKSDNLSVKKTSVTEEWQSGCNCDDPNTKKLTRTVNLSDDSQSVDAVFGEKGVEVSVNSMPSQSSLIQSSTVLPLLDLDEAISSPEKSMIVLEELIDGLDSNRIDRVLEKHQEIINRLDQIREEYVSKFEELLNDLKALGSEITDREKIVQSVNSTSLPTSDEVEYRTAAVTDLGILNSAKEKTMSKIESQQKQLITLSALMDSVNNDVEETDEMIKKTLTN